jgi:hypothetical protein
MFVDLTTPGVKSEMEEKRASKRWPCLMPCECKIRRRVLDGYIVELSDKGGRISLPADTTMNFSSMRITLRPEIESTVLTGKVIHTIQKSGSPAEVGVQFTGSVSQLDKKLKPFLPASRTSR